MPHSIAIAIFRTHARRVGFSRALLGGILMYLTLPLFIFLHLAVTLVLYRAFVRPLTGLPRLPSGNYLILDRYNLAGLRFFDRLNCLFCEYANGTITLLGAELDRVAVCATKPGVIARALIVLALIPTTLVLLVGMLLATAPTNILMKLLGLHRGSHKRIARRLAETGYAALLPRRTQRTVRFYKMVTDVIAYNLRQIESAWCPIKHLERAGYVLPPHHDRFFDRANLPELERTLAARGTVLEERAPS